MSKTSRKKKREIRNIETHLKNYNTYKVGIKNLKKKIEMILPNMTTRYELRENTSGVFVIYSSTEKAALDRVEGRQAMIASETIQLYQMIVDAIDLAVTELTELEQKYVRLRYFQNRAISQFHQVFGYSERTVRRIGFNVMNQFLISLANIKDLKL